MRRLANAEIDVLREAAAEEETKRTAHVDEVASRLDEAHASGTCPNVVVFLAQAGDGRHTRKGRAFANRDALEESFASMGIPCLRLQKSEDGIHTHSSISDFDRYLYNALPPYLRACRRRVVVVFPKQHVYPTEPHGMAQTLAAHLASKCRVFSETLADAALADVTVLDDLDSPRLDPYRAFVKVDAAFLVKWRADRGHGGGTQPLVMLNVAAGFRSAKDVSDDAAKARKAELEKVVGPGDFKLKDNSSRKKEPFDFDHYLKPNGVFDLARLKALKLNFEKQIKAAKEVKGGKKFNFDWWGKSELSQSNLARTLACSKFQSNGRGGVGVMGDYVKALKKEINKLEASTTG